MSSPVVPLFSFLLLLFTLLEGEVAKERGLHVINVISLLLLGLWRSLEQKEEEEEGWRHGNMGG